MKPFRRALALLSVVCLLFAAIASAAEDHPNVARGFDPEKAYAFDEVGAVSLFNGNLNVPIPLGQSYPVGPNLSYGFSLYYGGNNWSSWSKSEPLVDENGVPICVFNGNVCNAVVTDYGWTYPSKDDNAGLGWRLNLGQLSHRHPDPSNEYAYTGPDGSSHRFYESIHADHGEGGPDLWYTRDGSYLRMVVSGAESRIDFPDGTKNYFDTPTGEEVKGVTRMEDLFGNLVTVDYHYTGALPQGAYSGAKTVWHIHDSRGRDHYVYLKEAASWQEKELDQFEPHEAVAAVQLQALHGATPEYASWTFVYEGQTKDGTDTAPWSSLYRPYSGLPLHAKAGPYSQVTLLTELQQPDGTKYTFDYDRTAATQSWNWTWPETSPGQVAPDDGLAAGSLRELKMPAGAAIRWNYVVISYPPGQIAPGTPKAPKQPSKSLAVLQRKTFSSDNVEIGNRTYLWESDNPGGSNMELQDRPIEKRVTVTDYDGSSILRRSQHFFGICATNACPEGAVKGEYTLPFTHRAGPYNSTALAGTGRYLSSITFGPGTNNSWNVPLTMTYVGYESDLADLSQTDLGKFDYNRRLRSQRTADWIGGTVANCVDDDFTNFDGLGHYRTTTRRTSCGSSPARVTTIAYNQTTPSAGRVAWTSNDWPWTTGTNFVPSREWLLDTYSSQSVQEGAFHEKTLFDFVPSDPGQSTGLEQSNARGMLRRKRVLKDGLSPGGEDLVTQYNYTSGDVVRELNFGGDGNTMTFPALSAEFDESQAKFAVDHTYSNGLLTASKYATMPFFTLDRDLDLGTGLTLTSRDTAGVATTYLYDTMGRLTRVTPAGRAITEYVWEPIARRVTVSSFPAGSDLTDVTALTRSIYDYDSFGRLSQERQRAHDGGYMRREHTYDALGRPHTISVWGTDATLSVTSVVYDALGRTTSTTAPDGAVTSFTYPSSRDKTRTTNIWDGTRNVPVTTAEHYDGYGRLDSVTEDSGPTESGHRHGSSVTTAYGYDVSNHLVSVLMAGTQSRTFHYDGRGFLQFETHPESGTTTYQYDARGHVTDKLPAKPEFRLTYDYDAAERPLHVFGANGLPLQEFVYDAPDGAHSLGKLWKAIRYNYPEPVTLNYVTQQGTITVTESYGYNDDAGRRTDRDTMIDWTGGHSVAPISQSTHYTDLDQPDQVTYPVCLGCAAPDRVSVTTGYQNGRLDSVSEALSSVQYAPNGAWSRREHTNGLVDIQVPDDHGLPRPKEIRVERSGICNLIALQPQSTQLQSGHAITLTVAATRQDVTYAWFAGTMGDTTHPVQGANTNALPLTNVTATATYWCRVTGPDCAEDSASATVTICHTPVMSFPAEDAVNQTSVPAGVPIAFSVHATGEGLTYAWTVRTGANGAETGIGTSPSISYTPNAVTATNAPLFIRITVINACGTVFRDAAVLSVIEPANPVTVACTAQWSSVPPPLVSTIMPNEATTLTATLMLDAAANAAYPTRRYNFKWYQDGELTQQNLGVTTDSSTFTLRYVNQAYARVDGTITCINPSTGAELTSPVLTAPTYGIMYGVCPVPEVKVAGATLYRDASGHARLEAEVPYPDATVQWYEGESGNTRTEVFGGNARIVTVGETGTYWLRATTACGTHTDSATVTVATGTCTPVRIKRDPQDAFIAAGTDVTLSVDAGSNQAPNYYVWSIAPESNIAGSQGQATLHVAPIRTTDYAVRVGNGCSLVRSRYARVHVTSCGTIDVVSQPADVTVPAGASAFLTIDAVAATQLYYQWYAGESGDTSHPVPGVAGTASTLLLDDAVTQKYWVRVSFHDTTRCEVDSRTATVSACRLDVYRRPADASSNAPGLRQTFDVGANGDQLTYAWFQGEDNDRTHPLQSTTNAVAVYPLVTTKYWAELTSDCAAPLADRTEHEPFTVSVCPSFTAAPTADKTVVMPNTTTTLHATAVRGDVITWFIRNANGVTQLKDAQNNPITGANIVTPPVTAQTTFFARATSGNCTKESGDVTISLCLPPHVQWRPVVAQVEKDQTQTLIADVGQGDDPVEWRWYSGPTAGDVAGSQLVYQSSNAFLISTTQTTKYWIRVTKPDTGCYADSSVVTISVCIPKITAQPQSITINQGASTTLSVTADLPGMTYQWFTGQPGDTSHAVTAELTSNTVSVTPAADTTYWVRVKGCVARDSAAATVTICQPPAITTQPHDEALTAPVVTLTVTATGTDLTYQWYRGLSGDTANAVSGATSRTIDLNPGTTTDYWVRVSGHCGSVNSAAAKVSVRPGITTQPAGGVITKGTTRTLTLAASGTQLAYQWYQRAGATPTLISGAAATSYTPPPITVDSTYFGRVSSGSLSIDTADATFNVCQPRTIGVVGTAGLHSGDLTTLRIDNPAGDETFQWYRGASGDISNPLNGGGTTKSVQPLESTQYWARTIRTGCTADSAALLVRICLPTVNAQPQSGTITAGSTATLLVAATGTPALTYQWYIGAKGVTTSPVANATSASYTTPALSSTTTYWVRVTSPSAGCGASSTDSEPATVTVCQPPAIGTQPGPHTFARNTSNSLSVVATGDALHYQWYKGAAGDTSLPVGTDGNTLTFTATATASYWVRITGTCGTVDSVAALQSVIPTITTQPADAMICGLGASATFTVSATGGDTFAWYRQVSGQAKELVGTAQTLTIAVTQVPVNFSVEVWSGAAKATSLTASVNVNPVPTVNSFTATVQNVNQTQYKLEAFVKTSDQPLVKYKFYQGALGNTSTLLADSTFSYKVVTLPSHPMTYWVRVYYTDTGCPADRAVTIP